MASKQSGTTGETGSSGMPDNLRQAAETTIAQAKQAVDQYMRQATRLQETVDTSVQAAQAGTRDTNQKVFETAEANLNATFDFAQQLVRAKDPQEAMSLHQRFMQQQFERLQSQMKELGEHATQTAQSVGAAVQPKR
ncbi:MAG: phasin family protein [Microvirga sp.]|jgi:phasin